MLRSFSEFKFFQSFRVPVEEADEVRFLVEYEDENGALGYIEDAKIVDVSINGIGFTTKRRLIIDQDLRISVHFKKIHLDLETTVVRAFTGNAKQNTLLYGAEFEESDRDDINRFLEQYIYSFGPERLRDSMVQMALTDRYSTASEGFEMFSLMLSLFKDMTNFAEKEDFMNVMLEEVIRIMNAQRASVFLVNPDTNELEAVAALGTDKKLLRFDYRKGIAGSVFTTGLSLNIDTLTDSSRFSSEIDDMTGYKTKSVICNPISNREDKIIGVVEVLNKRVEERFNVDDEKTMKVVALVFSSVFHNYNPLSQQSAIRKFSAPVDREYILIGKSKAALAIRNSILKMKDLDNSIYIYGEPGAGKGLLAKIIHHEGKYGLHPYEEVYCGGQEDSVVDKLIFGDAQTKGALEKCSAGTVSFREVHLLSLPLQKKLLHVLTEKRIEERKIALDVRIVVTSSRALDRLVADGFFNRDLFQLISKAYVVVEPLRKRQEDIKDLINHFLKMECKKQGFLLKSFSPSVMKSFLEYEWPNNIAELKQCIERAVLYNPKNHVISNITNMATPLLDNSKMGMKMFEDIPYAADPAIIIKDRLALVERQMILTEIKRHNGNKSKAAREMGISREALRKKLMLSQEIIEMLEGHKGREKTRSLLPEGLDEEEDLLAPGTEGEIEGEAEGEDIDDAIDGEVEGEGDEEAEGVVASADSEEGDDGDDGDKTSGKSINQKAG